MNALQGALEANLVRIEERRITRVELAWDGGIITTVCELGPEAPSRNYLIPGFVDAHVHIESSLLPPSEFARLAVRHGTLACVSDPHEIANVLGVDGVRFMLDNARASGFPILFGAPSCVPATAFETAGAELGTTELATLLEDPDIGYLAEVMNFPGVLASNPEVLAKIALARRMGLPVDGHAPGLTATAAQAYAKAGMSTDHECSNLDEALDKIAAGMRILIREGSAAHNFDALQPLIATHSDRVMFCSDDKHPDDLARGHIDRLAARAVAAGHDVFAVLRSACLNPVLHYRLPLGRLRVGDSMDAVEVADLHEFQPLRSWLRGRLVAKHGASFLPRIAVQPQNRFWARRLRNEDLWLTSTGGPVRAIEAMDGELTTREIHLIPTTVDGRVVPDTERDLLFLLVLNRYRPAPPALALIRGFGLKRGALASSVAHDSHNVIAVGATSEALIAVVNAVVDSKGGLAATDGERLELLPLPIAGLMSPEDGDSVAQRYSALDTLAKQMGSPLSAPFMTLSFMALLVIPELKLSDLGLFDARQFRFTSLHV